jgi:hypothetical protein
MKRNKLLARFIALHGVRNTQLEDLHSGISPSSRTSDFSDVKVITPYGEIPWTKLSRISDEEMRSLMLDVEKNIYKALEIIPQLEEKAGSPKKFDQLLKTILYDQGGASWDVPEQEMINRYGIDYKEKL